ncbi:MAG: thioredoxin domain-containing protein [Pirellulales bacterium]|nr:thioredoxin domain-containing protein [Pirellulales bacterium]
MRTNTLLLALAIALPCCGTSLRADDAVNWSTDLTAAKRLAAQTNRLVLVHFWAPWCKPCLKMDTTVFADEGLGPTLSQQYVMVKLNLDNYKGLATQYGIRSIPADVVITPGGKLIEKTSSPRTAANYVNSFQTIAAANLPAQPVTRMASAVASSDAAPAAYVQQQGGYDPRYSGAVPPSQQASNQAPPIPGYRSQVQSAAGNQTDDKYAARENIPYRDRVSDPYLPQRTALDTAEDYRKTASQFNSPTQDVRTNYDPNQFSRNAGVPAAPVQVQDSTPGLIRNQFAVAGNAAGRDVQPKSVFPAQQQTGDNPIGSALSPRYANAGATSTTPTQIATSGDRYADHPLNPANNAGAVSTSPPWGGPPSQQRQVGEPPVDRYADRSSSGTSLNATSLSATETNSQTAPTPPSSQGQSTDRYADYRRRQDEQLAGQQATPPSGSTGSNPYGASQQLRSQSVPRIPSGNPPLAFQGFCVVTMMDRLPQGGAWVQGNTAWGARHEGRTYLFADQQSQQKFLADPHRYAPLVSGVDIVHFLESNEIRDGNVHHGVFVDGRILLFTSEENLQKFSRAPDTYFNGLRQAQLENRLQIR